MSTLSLRDLGIWLRLDCVDDVWEFDRVLDEEDRYIVANNIPITLISVELHGEATDISDGVGTASTSLYCGEAQENRCRP